MFRRIRRCVNCGMEIDGDARECIHCGAEEAPRKIRPHDAPAPVPPGTISRADNLLSGRYRPIKKLGRGSMGVVYLARDVALEIDVVLKFLPETIVGNSDVLERLSFAAKLAMSLAHPNLVRLHDFVDSDRFRFLVMEYINGASLEEVIEAKGSLPLDSALPVARAICEGVEYAHSQNIVLDNLNPANVMLTLKGEVKIMALGVIREVHEFVGQLFRNASAAVRGYMSPEETRGEVTTAKSNVYGIGATVYGIMAGHPPFFEGDILAQIQLDDPPPVRGIQEPVNQVLLAALSKDPEKRQRTASAFYEELTEAVLKTPPEKPSYKSQTEILEFPEIQEVASPNAPSRPGASTADGERQSGSRGKSRFGEMFSQTGPDAQSPPIEKEEEDYLEFSEFLDALEKDLFAEDEPSEAPGEADMEESDIPEWEEVRSTVFGAGVSDESPSEADDYAEYDEILDRHLQPGGPRPATPVEEETAAFLETARDALDEILTEYDNTDRAIPEPTDAIEENVLAELAQPSFEAEASEGLEQDRETESFEAYEAAVYEEPSPQTPEQEVFDAVTETLDSDEYDPEEDAYSQIEDAVLLPEEPLFAGQPDDRNDFVTESAGVSSTVGGPPPAAVRRTAFAEDGSSPTAASPVAVSAYSPAPARNSPIVRWLIVAILAILCLELGIMAATFNKRNAVPEPAATTRTAAVDNSAQEQVLSLRQHVSDLQHELQAVKSAFQDARKLAEAQQAAFQEARNSLQQGESSAKREPNLEDVIEAILKKLDERGRAGGSGLATAPNGGTDTTGPGKGKEGTDSEKTAASPRGENPGALNAGSGGAVRAASADLRVPGDCASIQEALDKAASGNTILVADGTYRGAGNRDIDFKGKSVVLRSENGPAKCIIDCEQSGRGFYFHSDEKENSILDGFTIRNGTATHGGAILCDGASPTIANCTIEKSSASYGGGVCCRNAAAVMARCRIVGNEAQYGGGIYCRNANTILVNCLIAHNSATSGKSGNGGGIWCGVYSSPAISLCTIAGNSANSRGGGICCVWGSSPTLTNSIVWGNVAHGTGHQISAQSSGRTDEPASAITLHYCYYGNSNGDTAGGTGIAARNCTNRDPKFLDYTGGDFRLNAASPCIDTGSNTHVPSGLMTDLDGNPRIAEGTVDIGAYEHQPSGKQ